MFPYIAVHVCCKTCILFKTFMLSLLMLTLLKLSYYFHFQEEQEAVCQRGHGVCLYFIVFFNLQMFLRVKLQCEFPYF